MIKATRMGRTMTMAAAAATSVEVMILEVTSKSIAVPEERY